MPDIRIADPTPSIIHVIATPPRIPVVADSGAVGLTNTHTTPPYPSAASAASHQGTVVLLMTVSVQGDVVAATIVQSSGYSDLDQAAMSWVVAHWKYRPAVIAGTPAASQTEAAVKFDLKQAHR